MVCYPRGPTCISHRMWRSKRLSAPCVVVVCDGRHPDRQPLLMRLPFAAVSAPPLRAALIGRALPRRSGSSSCRTGRAKRACQSGTFRTMTRKSRRSRCAFPFLRRALPPAARRACACLAQRALHGTRADRMPQSSDAARGQVHQLRGVAHAQACVSALRRALFHALRGRQRQRARVPRVHPPLRRGARPTSTLQRALCRAGTSGARRA